MFCFIVKLFLTCLIFFPLQIAGRLKLSETQIIFKSDKTGKLDTLSSKELKKISWQRMADGSGIRFLMKNGQVFRYGGFKDSDKEKLEKFISNNYSVSLETQESSIRGWNWGTTSFEGSVLNFDVKKNERAFEIPLSNVGHTTTAKNEVTLEFHQNDDTPVSLMEMRFHIPTIDGVDPVQNFIEKVLQKASIIRETGECIAIFKELQCLTPRGRYDIKIFPTFIQLHGKTFDYKIPINSVLRMFQLPHKDTRSVYFVLSLDPPIKQGQTRYHFLILLFNKEEENETVELALSETEIKDKYHGKLNKVMSGPMFEIVSKLIRVLLEKKITLPDPNFVNSARDIPAVSCSYRASNGMMYPLERGFIYLHKPPVHIRFDEIQSINFARSGGSTRSFDFEIETKTGVVHTFSSIEKEEYSKLFDFVSTKGLRVKNVGTEGDKKKKVHIDDLIDSDVDDDEPDAYLHKVREEGRVRTELGDSDESDDDFNPDAEDDGDVAEEFDSEVSDSSNSEAATDSEGDKKRKKKHKEKKVKKAKTEKKKKSSKDDDGRPKKPSSAYFIWMKEAREQIKKDNPGIGVTDVAKRAGELWKEVKDKSKYEEMAAKEKKNYEKLVAEWKANGGGAGASTSKASSSSSSKHKSKKSSDSKKSSSTPTKSQSGFKSQQYIDSDSSSSSDEDSQKKKKSNDKGGKSSKKDKKSDDSDVVEDSASGSDSDGDKKKKSKGKPKEKSKKKDDSDDSDNGKKGGGSESEEILSSPTASSASDSD